MCFPVVLNVQPLNRKCVYRTAGMMDGSRINFNVLLFISETNYVRIRISSIFESFDGRRLCWWTGKKNKNETHLATCRRNGNICSIIWTPRNFPTSNQFGLLIWFLFFLRSVSSIRGNMCGTDIWNRVDDDDDDDDDDNWGNEWKHLFVCPNTINVYKSILGRSNIFRYWFICLAQTNAIQFI